jgi:hypothetical protein
MKPIDIGVCSLDGCERPTFNKDVCERHFDPQHSGRVELDTSDTDTGKTTLGTNDASVEEQA